MSHVFYPRCCVGVCFETSSDIPKSDCPAKFITTRKSQPRLVLDIVYCCDSLAFCCLRWKYIQEPDRMSHVYDYQY